MELDSIENKAADLIKFVSPSSGSAQAYAPLTLAYIGDCVFDLFVRTMIISKGNFSVNALHNKSKSFVSAQAQSKMYYAVEKNTTDFEKSILRRGRNTKSFTKAKNASVSEYRHATGLEALFGYLYLAGEIERLKEIFELCIKSTDDA